MVFLLEAWGITGISQHSYISKFIIMKGTTWKMKTPHPGKTSGYQKPGDAAVLDSSEKH